MRKSIFAILVALALILNCGTINDAHAAAKSVFETHIVTVPAQPVTTISPLIYGINYTWNIDSANQFAAWNAIVQSTTHYTLAQFPGGWNVQHYDWETNSEPLWGDPAKPWNGYFDPATMPPGPSPNKFISTVPQAFFNTKDSTVVQGDATSPNFQADIDALTAEAVKQVSRYGGRVKIWEIGNEWWFQGSSDSTATQKRLANYAALVRSEVPAMMAANPSLKIFVSADWTHPEEYEELRRQVGSAVWSQLAGVSMHTYCGTQAAPLCSSIPTVANQVRTITGKSTIFDAQWLVTPKNTPDDYGIENANAIVGAIQNIAFANMYAAITWPVTGFVPNLNFVTDDLQTPLASGLVFGWMSRYYEGEALQPVGDIPAVAAQNGDEVTVIIPGGDIGGQNIRVVLQDREAVALADAEVMSPTNPDVPRQAGLVTVSPLAVTAKRQSNGDTRLEFTINPGSGSRASNWEIARITLKRHRLIPAGYFSLNSDGTLAALYSNGSSYCAYSTTEQFFEKFHLSNAAGAKRLGNLPQYINIPPSMIYAGVCR